MARFDHVDNASTSVTTIKPRFTFQRVSHIRHRAVPEIIMGYIPMGLKGLFYGDEKTFKTPVAVKIGVDVAMPNVTHHGDPKIPGLGYEVLRHGAVRYIAAELPKGVQSRAREYIRARDPSVDPSLVDFRVLDAKPDLTAETDVKELISALDASLDNRATMRLIFIDTTVYCLGYADENHPLTVTKVYNAADRIIAHYQESCSVIFILHTGKNEYRGVRGSSNWEKSVGFRLEFSASGNIKEIVSNRTISYPKTAIVRSEKNKDGPYQQVIQYKVTRETFEASEIDYIHDLPQPVEDSVLHLSVEPYSKAESSGSTGIKNKTREALIQKIVRILSLVGERKYVNYATLAETAEKANLLEGDKKTRVKNFRKRVYRFMLKYSGELDIKYFRVSRMHDGATNYTFIGQVSN
jgi:RecA-family ATPase